METRQSALECLVSVFFLGLLQVMPFPQNKAVTLISTHEGWISFKSVRSIYWR
jgi:hypothetical protein